MPEDTLRVTIDPSNSFDVLSRLGTGFDRLSGSGQRMGDGFIRGERVVRTATGNIAASLLSVNDAASVAVVAMQGLERVFRIGLLPTVAVAAAVAAFEVFHKQIEKTREASDALGKELGKAVGLEVQGSVESLTSDVDALSDKMAKLKKEASSPTTKILNALLGKDDSEAAQLRRAEHGRPEQLAATKEQQQLIAGEERLKELASARADKEVKIAEAKRDQNKIGRLELTFEDQRSKLFQGAFKAGLNMVDLMKRLIALQITLKDEVLKEVEARHESVRAAKEKFLSNTRNLFKDIGSGQFLKDQQQRNLDNQQVQSGQEMAKQFAEDAAKGIPLGPNAAAMVNAANAAAAKGGVTLEDITQADFSNLDVLSKYDFSGLAPLSGLTIQIQ